MSREVPENLKASHIGEIMPDDWYARIVGRINFLLDEAREREKVEKLQSMIFGDPDEQSTEYIAGHGRGVKAERSRIRAQLDTYNVRQRLYKAAAENELIAPLKAIIDGEA